MEQQYSKNQQYQQDNDPLLKHNHQLEQYELQVRKNNDDAAIDHIRKLPRRGDTSEADEQEQLRLVNENPDSDRKMNSYVIHNDEVHRDTGQHVPSPVRGTSTRNSASSPSTPRIIIDRPVINQLGLYPKRDPSSDGNGTNTAIQRSFSLRKKYCSCNPLKLLITLFPILDWLPKYEWKSDLTYDLVAGFTVAVMQIPQGMAYALLASLPPIVGIYMAFFPVIVYSFMGTSRHVSMGTFAVICLMTGKVALDRLAFELDNGNISRSIPQATYYGKDAGDFEHISQEYDIEELIQNDPIVRQRMIEIATAISLVVGLWQFAMGVLRLGSLSLLLSSELVSGFTTGAAVHVFTSQVKSLLGVPIPRRSGIFKIILTYVDIVKNITKTNLMAVALSIVTIAFLLVYNELIKPYVSKKTRFPVPVELITIIIGTLISMYTDLEGNYNISIISTIPTGFPVPKLAPLDVASSVVVDALIISIVAYAISISMCKIFAAKHNYIVDPNQELIAQGSSNVVGSFFSCAPIAVSLSRSVIQDAVGGRTQLASLFTSAIIVFVLLWIGPFFETLPSCILSGIIVVALKGMFMQFAEIPKIWKVSKISTAIWILSFLGTVVLDIEYGLGIGVGLAILTLLWSSTHGKISTLGVYGNYELYLDVKLNQVAKEVPGIKIFKYTGTLNFVNGEGFVREIEDKISIHIEDNALVEKMLFNSALINASVGSNGETVGSIESRRSLTMRRKSGDPLPINKEIEWVLLDFSSLSSVDGGAVRSILGMYKRLLKEDIQILFCGIPSSCFSIMESTSFFTDIGISSFFPTVHDAVTRILSIKSSNNNSHRRRH